MPDTASLFSGLTVGAFGAGVVADGEAAGRGAVLVWAAATPVKRASAATAAIGI